MPLTYPIGGIQITGNVNAFLFGLMSMQSYKYFRDHMDDPTVLKMVVLSTFVFAAIHTGCLEWAIYIVAVVDNRADVPYLKQPNSAVVSIASGQTAQFLVQAYWVYRIYRLHHHILAMVLIVPVIYVFVTAVVSAFFTWDQPIAWVLTYQHSRKFLILSQLVATATIDVTIAIMLFLHLRKSRTTCLSRTMEYIDTFICKWTFQTGMITGATAISVILAFIIRKENSVWYCLYTSLMNLYPLTCVALLNGRSAIQMSTTDDVLTSVQMQVVSTSGVYGNVVRMGQASKITSMVNTETCNAPPSLSTIGEDKDSAGLKFGLGSTPSYGA